jgi:hypothetical protein
MLSFGAVGNFALIGDMARRDRQTATTKEHSRVAEHRYAGLGQECTAHKQRYAAPKILHQSRKSSWRYQKR